MRTLWVVAATALIGASIGVAAPANACVPWDGSCGYINPDPHSNGWAYGGWYEPGWYGGNYWCGGYWYGQWC